MADLLLSAETRVEVGYNSLEDVAGEAVFFQSPVGRTTQHVSPLYECTYGYHLSVLYEEKPNLLIALYTVLSTIERDKTFCTAIFYTSRANNAN